MQNARTSCVVGVLTAGLVLGLGQRARADTLLYDNGPFFPFITNENPTVMSLAVSDSFTVNSASSITSVNIGIWSPYDRDPNTVTWGSVQWSIGNGAFESDISSGTSLLSTQLFAADPGVPFPNSSLAIWSADFSVIGIVGPGTYWLTLSNVTSSVGDSIWDEIGGPSSAQQDQVGIIPSESFRIYGDVSPTPEPSSLVLLCMGFVSVCGATFLTKKRIAAAK